MRIVGDYVYVNSQLEKAQPCGPHTMDQIRHAGGHRAYWHTDGDQQYQGWGLHEDSRDVLSIWTPIGLLRPTRLQFGETNAGIVMQGDVRIMLERDLDPHSRNHIVNGVDDFTGFCGHSVDESSGKSRPAL